MGADVFCVDQQGWWEYGERELGLNIEGPPSFARKVGRNESYPCGMGR